MRTLSRWILGVLIVFPISASAAASAQASEYRQWIEEMKEAPRGPFARLRWFCADGSVLAPEPYACVPHGGGVQHGEWTDRVKTLRADGYYVANLLAGGHGARVPLQPGHRQELSQLLLEQFLVQHDDGWIYRKARTYRGGIQVEDESAASQTLLYRLAQLPSLPNQDLLLLRQAFMLLPGSQDSPQASVVRQLSTILAERYPAFEPVRAKIHGQPDASDAATVRQFLERHPLGETEQFETLATAIDALFADPKVDQRLQALAKVIRTPALRQELDDAAMRFRLEPHADTRFLTAGSLLAAMRQFFPSETNSQVRLDMLKTSLALEQEMLRMGNVLIKYRNQVSRKSQLGWLSGANDALYGTGLISARQWLAVSRAIDASVNNDGDIADYRSQLNYIARVPGWGSRWLAFHFEDAVERYDDVEPKALNFIPDRLRGSMMLVFNRILDGLMMDADRLAGVRSSLFGTTVGSGLRALNAGVARGVLHLEPPDSMRANPNGIYMLPETTADLPPVAGILTSGEGNALSHVQLLASNLGIPNVVVGDELLPQLRLHAGQRIVMSVSPGGVVRIEQDSDHWDAVIPRDPSATPNSKLLPDYGKLDLMQDRLVDLADIRASDSGIICGPKAANLGELKHHFPDAVTDGLVIPFGVFNNFLQHTGPDGNLSAKDWLQQQYQHLDTLTEPEKSEATSLMLQQMRRWILSTDPGPEFRKHLKMAVNRTFGTEGQYSIFVRSDTNVEDLPGFTGAGLNLTVPNVRRFHTLVNAILKVWASPFEERAYAWRQQRMQRPEWVFPSVLLLRSVEVDKSGVMLTVNPETGNRDELTVAMNQGIGGAVSGGAAEEIRLNRKTGEVYVLADSTSPTYRRLGTDGNLVAVARSADGDVLEVNEMQTLIDLSVKVEERMPDYSSNDESGIADIEFGFTQGRLVLFQIRPFIQGIDGRVQKHLQKMDESATAAGKGKVNLLAPPVL